MLELSPLYVRLVERVYVTSQPECFRRLSRQPGKDGYSRFRACWVWWVNLVRSLEKSGVIQMSSNGKSRPEFKGFVNVRLTDEDKEILVSSDETDIRGLIDNAVNLMFEGYKIAFAYDKTSGAVQATMTCWQEGSPDFGYAISARNPDFDRALHTLLYKHFSICRGCWSEHNPPAPQMNNWD